MDSNLTYKAAIEETKAIHTQIKKLLAENKVADVDDLHTWKVKLASIYKHLNKMKRYTNALDERQQIEASIFRQEMRDELVSREAIAARTAERFRVLTQTGVASEAESPFDRAHRTAVNINKSICQVGCRALSVNRGTVSLHKQLD